MNLKRDFMRYCLPASWRARHGDEVEEFLAAEGWKLRDLADVLLLGLTLRTEELRRWTAMRYVAGIVLVAIGLAGALWSTTELTNGLSDVHEHWWSMAAVSPAIAGAVILITGVANRMRLA